MIRRVHVYNYRCLERFAFDCNPTLNILVGNNETGKSTVLEAIYLALTKRLNGRYLEVELTPHLFTKAVVSGYVAKIAAGTPAPLPRIAIQLFFDDRPEFAHLRGSNNALKLDCPGVHLEVLFDEEYREEYDSLLKKPGAVTTIPIEYYKVDWLSFASNPITARSLPIAPSYIDATTIRLQSGTDYYLQSIITSSLSEADRIALAIAYRSLREQFAADPTIKQLNAPGRTAILSQAPLTFGVETTTRASWETSLVPRLADVPFAYIGKGEQSALKTMLALEQKAQDAAVVLIEEPENHLTFASMKRLIRAIADKCQGKQLFITTHSAYVLNKLGMDQVLMMVNPGVGSLSSLSEDTREYFRKLPGYDTLRLILARKAVLVEGPSDELIFQRAYRDIHQRLPSEDGIDVITVRGLSFARFLEIAKPLQVPVVVLTDNDADYEGKVVAKYAGYTSGTSAIRVFAPTDNDQSTIELCMLASNGASALGQILGKAFADDAAAAQYMLGNKTEVAMKIFDSPLAVKHPEHLLAAVKSLA